MTHVISSDANNFNVLYWRLYFVNARTSQSSMLARLATIQTEEIDIPSFHAV